MVDAMRGDNYSPAEPAKWQSLGHASRLRENPDFLARYGSGERRSQLKTRKEVEFLEYLTRGSVCTGPQPHRDSLLSMRI
jgi:hypothetical protein